MRHLYRHLFRVAAFTALLGLTAGCSGLIPEAPIRAGTEAAQAAEGESSLFDTMADQILAAGSQEERALRVCFFTAAAAEVYTYRLLYYGGQEGELDTAFGAVSRLRANVQRVRDQGRTLWFETEMFYTVVGIVRAIEGPLRDRALGAAFTVASQDWRGIARGIRTAGGQALLAGAMLRDARNAAELLRAGEIGMDAAWNACQGRIEGRLAALAGALGIDAPQQLRIGPGG